jgi:hypothetical protein
MTKCVQMVRVYFLMKMAKFTKVTGKMDCRTDGGLSKILVVFTKDFGRMAKKLKEP